ncbi:MAG TPA: hypothetical protein VN915_08655 [Elusimicrobiota bacterium]|nr:hypothetical protein [Elusimicrobiota bacterium]
MRSIFARFWIAVIAAVAMLAIISDQGVRAPVAPPGVSRRAAASIDDWPAKPRALARLMTQKYGRPNEAMASQVSWNGRGPWKKIVVFRDPDPAGRQDFLLQSVAYGAVPVDHHWRDLAAFGRGGAAYDPSSHELTARTDSQETNYLALNLADEVLRGRRSARDAQDFYDAASHLSAAGKSSPYMSGLLFAPRAAPR